MNKNVKTVLIVALSLFGAGAILFAAADAMVGFRLSKLDPRSGIGGADGRSRLIEQVYADRGQSLKIDVSYAWVMVKPSDDGEIHVKCQENETSSFDFGGGENDIALTQKERAGSFSGWGFLSEGGASVELSVPEGHKGDLRIVSASGGTDISGLELDGTITIGSASGYVRISGTGAGDIGADTVSGGISLKNLKKCGDVRLGSTSGVVDAENTVFGNIKIDTVSGRVELEAVSAQDAKVTTTSGSLRLKSGDLRALSFGSVSGGAEAALKGMAGDYRVTAESLSGRCSVPSGSGTGGRTLDFRTTSGNISVSFENS